MLRARERNFLPLLGEQKGARGTARPERGGDKKGTRSKAAPLPGKKRKKHPDEKRGVARSRKG